MVYRYKDGKLQEKSTLWESLNLPFRKHMVISLVGGGGKTTSMYRLADELKEMGKRVIVTTSTHIQHPADRMVVLADCAVNVGKWIAEKLDFEENGSVQCLEQSGNLTTGWVLVTGIPVTATENESGMRKLKGMTEDKLAGLAGLADVLLIEADGAKRLPFKIPRDGEPVLIKETDAVIGCMGLDCIGETFEDKCFRKELAEELLTESGLWQGLAEPITPACAAAVLSSEKGTRKSVGNREYRILLNKADVESGVLKALAIIEHLEPELQGKCVVAGLF